MAWLPLTRRRGSARYRHSEGCGTILDDDQPCGAPARFRIEQQHWRCHAHFNLEQYGIQPRERPTDDGQDLDADHDAG